MYVSDHTLSDFPHVSLLLCSPAHIFLASKLFHNLIEFFGTARLLCFFCTPSPSNNPPFKKHTRHAVTSCSWLQKFTLRRIFLARKKRG